MKGLGKILLENKKVIGLARVLLEQNNCDSRNFFSEQGGVGTTYWTLPGDEDKIINKMKGNQGSYQGCEDTCVREHFNFYKNDLGGTKTLITICGEDVAGEEDVPVEGCPGRENEELVSYAKENGYVDADTARAMDIKDTTVNPPKSYPGGFDENGELEWSTDKSKFFEQKEFYNDEDGSCSKVFLYKKIDEYVSVWGDTEGIEFGDDITDFCTPEELSKAGDGNWKGFYVFEYKNGRKSCLINDWSYVQALGISWGPMDEDVCYDEVRFSDMTTLKGAIGYKLPINRPFFRINKGCVDAKWKRETMVVDPTKYYGGKEKVKTRKSPTSRSMPNSRF